MQAIIELIKKNIDGQSALLDVREIANFHRIQASPGYRQAALHVQKKLVDHGLDSRIHSFPADSKQFYYQAKMFCEWQCQDAFLQLDNHTVLASYRDNPLSVIQRSYPCDYRDTPLDIVLLDKGPNKENYDDLDLTGKLIFVRTPFAKYVDWAIQEKGAVGIITDAIYEIDDVRTQSELYDILNYTSFWLKHNDNEARTFGFVLTPREGDKLAKRCIAQLQTHQKDNTMPAYIKATCQVDARFINGQFEVVDTVLKGQSDEEIWLFAHLCHPRASANDNASGVSAVMAIMKTLKALIDSGQLAPLKRTLRAIFIPEFTGTFAYLHEHWQDKNKVVLAGINLDMVGGRQTKGYGPLTISGLPDCLPSFVDSFAELVMDMVKPSHMSHSDLDSVSILNTARTAFDAGSDNYITSDPTFAIPTPMLGQWPDIHYHTSGDIPEVIDPFVLKMSASFGASYAYLLANLDSAWLPKILTKTRMDYFARLHQIVQQIDDKIKWRIDYCRNLQHEINGSLLAYFEADQQLEQYLKDEEALIANYTEQVVQRLGDLLNEDGEVPAAYRYIPRRLFKGPILRIDDLTTENPVWHAQAKTYLNEQRLKHGPHRYEALIVYHIDGKRSLWQIAKCLEMQCKTVDIKSMDAYIRLLQTIGLVDISE